MTNKLRLILLIDDDIDDNFFHKRVISKAGVAEQVVECHNGQEALDFLMNKGKYTGEGKPYPQPDLLFLDINMPQMNGWEFLDAYDKLPAHIQGGPVVAMLTTSTNPRDINKAMKYNIVRDYRNKPLTQEMLKDILEKYFSGQLNAGNR
ncbi:response regulator [Fulvivirga sp. M361]|uniref:response regulator n=1 Tax=Fulvivirga sp. M361 TaxID=2594266 RepID=UPI00117B9F1A|nr:response regulator [Fulvivirga sp. M361]TRX47190.1 response regulator [Fulvivirga sp. M361]